MRSQFVGRRSFPRIVSDSESEMEDEEFFDAVYEGDVILNDEDDQDNKDDESQDDNDANPSSDETSSFKSKKSGNSSSSSHCQKVPFHSRLGHRIDFVQLTETNKLTHVQKTYANRVFGDNRVVMYKMNPNNQTQGDMPPEYIEQSNGYVYQILGSKWQMKRQDHIPKQELTLYYVLVEGPGIPKICVQHELDKIANWGSLPPPKLSSRLELLFSTAVKSTRKEVDCLIFEDLSSSNDFELISEDSHVGCGFVPRGYLEQFLGSNGRGTRTFAIQVRIFSPKLGIFKGMLMEKPGINKIQLPPSMQKVGPSVCSLSQTNDKAAILINNIYPSNRQIQVSRMLDPGGKTPAASARPTKLKWMTTMLFRSLGVTEKTMEQYVQDSCVGYNDDLKHACVVGVADPTNAIPPGHIFVTGVLGTNADLPFLFTTRFPCTEKSDGLLLPLVTSKPEGMADTDWQFLSSLPFGAIIFGNALPGEASLPSKIARGDLDGDNYFICWNSEMIGQIQKHNIQITAAGEFDDGIMKCCPRNDNWFLDAQNCMSEISRISRLHGLIGKLCMARKKLCKDCGPECPDAEAFGIAYKDSLEVAKHGKKIRLPAHLWGCFSEDVQSLLIDVQDDSVQPCNFQNDESRHKVKKRGSRRNSPPASNYTEFCDLAGLEEGAAIEIVGGKNKGEVGSFLKLTACMVYVRIAGQTMRLQQKSVRPARVL